MSLKLRDSVCQPCSELSWRNELVSLESYIIRTAQLTCHSTPNRAIWPSPSSNIVNEFRKALGFLVIK